MAGCGGRCGVNKDTVTVRKFEPVGARISSVLDGKCAYSPDDPPRQWGSLPKPQPVQ